jgi:hypothetical protein
MDIAAALDTFGQRLEQSVSPSDERAVVMQLAAALGEQTTVEFEHPFPQGKVDLYVPAVDAAIEVKYHRPIPSGGNRPMTQDFGAVLNDIRRVGQGGFTTGIVVLLTDRSGRNHIVNRQLLPWRLPHTVTITESNIRSLAQVAQRNAIPQGETWVDVEVRRIWTYQVGRIYGIAWKANLATRSG